jgi:hypothetical protein
VMEIQHWLGWQQVGVASHWQQQVFPLGKQACGVSSSVHVMFCLRFRPIQGILSRIDLRLNGLEWCLWKPLPMGFLGGRR